MSALLVGLLGKIWPVIGGVVLGAGGLLWAWLKGKKADTTVAQAAASVSDAQAVAAQAQASAAATNEVAAQADQAAAQDALNKVKEAQNAKDTAGAMSGDAARQLLVDAGLVRNDDGSKADSLPASPAAGSGDKDAGH